jgi:hypothetical protein
MNITDVAFLTSAAAADWLAELAAAPPTPATHLALSSRLRQEAGPDRAQALLETALLRQRAAAKFSRAAQMLFTRPALEQATAEPVARHRAARFAGRGFEQMGDLGCGIGGDSLALTALLTVVGVERDPVRLAMARHNTAVYDAGHAFWPVTADLLELPPLAVDAFFFDPARRTATSALGAPSRRLWSLADYEPGFTVAERWRERVPHAAIKVSPAVDYKELPPDSEIEFVSLDGELKEAVLWFGDLRDGFAQRATVLPAAATLAGDETQLPDVPVRAPQAFLYEPDPAVIRAHLVQQVAADLDGAMIDSQIAYITAPDFRPTPFARAFRIHDHFPFQLKRLRSYLRERDVGRVTIKKRGSPLAPDELRRALRLRGAAHRIIFLTQVDGRATVLVGEAL